MSSPTEGQRPEGVSSLLDTDLYKLTMACVIWKTFRDVDVSYSFTNRTGHMRLNQRAYEWLEAQIKSLRPTIIRREKHDPNSYLELGNIRLTGAEVDFLKIRCKYLDPDFLSYLEGFRLRPTEHIQTSFELDKSTGDQSFGDINMKIAGRWIDTILYEIPLLALTSEAYFRFCDKDWNHDGQEDKSYRKGLELLSNGCFFSEFGTRRRRDYVTQHSVLRGLVRASKEAERDGLLGKLTGTSNVHFAMKMDIEPIGTVAHEWFMGVAAASDNYRTANELALRYWVDCFGEGILGIALTDTFGTPAFLEAFKQEYPVQERPATFDLNQVGTESTFRTKSIATSKTYAQIFNGVRQDSGDPLKFVGQMKEFYDSQGISDKKVVVFSDSLNVERCLEYKKAAESEGFQASFGVGTFFTNDFDHCSTGSKSAPLNIVIKLSSACGRPAIKISDNVGKNTGDQKTVEAVKRKLGYVENDWGAGDEKARWGA
ncbi:MAG: nicotinate phosphoribosyltransferase [Vezdaea aestivalis]|nr:MAG: nicotinate phosphoribosyltransferase [Vezdaea aestivalis]